MEAARVKKVTLRYPNWDSQGGAERSRAELNEIMWNFNVDPSRPITNALAFWYYHSVYLEDRN